MKLRFYGLAEDKTTEHLFELGRQWVSRVPVAGEELAFDEWLVKVEHVRHELIRQVAAGLLHRRAETHLFVEVLRRPGDTDAPHEEPPEVSIELVGCPCCGVFEGHLRGCPRAET